MTHSASSVTAKTETVSFEGTSFVLDTAYGFEVKGIHTGENSTGMIEFCISRIYTVVDVVRESMSLVELSLPSMFPIPIATIGCFPKPALVRL